MANITKLINEEPVDDRRNKAIAFMYMLFPFFIGRFEIYGAVDNSRLSQEDRKLAKRLERDMLDIMLYEENLAEPYPQANNFLKLTEKGLRVQREINQKLQEDCCDILFKKHKEASAYTINWTKDTILFAKCDLLIARNTLVNKKIVLIQDIPTTTGSYKQTRLHSNFSLADNYVQALQLIDSRNKRAQSILTQETVSYNSELDDKINHAKALFFKEDATFYDKRSACETLTFLLEPLRDDLTSFFSSSDVSDFFLIVNRFDIRHNKANTVKLNHEEQLEWIFYTLLNSLITYIKLKQKFKS